MKKRDLTKLVLMGMAAGSLVTTQSLSANELEEQINVGENLIAHGCASHGCKSSPTPPQSHGCNSSQRPSQNNAYPYQTQYSDVEQQEGVDSTGGQGQSQGNQPYYRSNQTAQPDSSPQKYNSQGRYLAALDIEDDLFLVADDEDEDIFLADDEEDQDQESLFASDEDEENNQEDVLLTSDEEDADSINLA